MIVCVTWTHLHLLGYFYGYIVELLGLVLGLHIHVHTGGYCEYIHVHITYVDACTCTYTDMKRRLSLVKVLYRPTG